MISIRDLDISYDGEIKVLDALNLELAESSIHGIVGLNGSGKTTLLNSIYGLQKINQGNISRNGELITKKHISYLVTENYFYSNITGSEYLSLFKNESFEINKWNELFSLPLNDIIDTYSTGMKKKLAIMGILKQNKLIMILDEPFNGLDIETSRIIRSVLLKLKEKGKTVIITSHIIETLTNLCDQIHYLEKGKIQFSKGKSEFTEFENQIFESIENKNIDIISELIK